jgi:hypothetical protein
MFDSSATRPYTVSAIANYKRAADLGFLSLDPAGKVLQYCSYPTWIADYLPPAMHNVLLPVCSSENGHLCCTWIRVHPHQPWRLDRCFHSLTGSLTYSLP